MKTIHFDNVRNFSNAIVAAADLLYLLVSKHLQLLCKDLYTVQRCQQRSVQLWVSSQMGQNGYSVPQEVHMRLTAIAATYKTQRAVNATPLCSMQSTMKALTFP